MNIDYRARAGRLGWVTPVTPVAAKPPAAIYMLRGSLSNHTACAGDLKRAFPQGLIFDDNDSGPRSAIPREDRLIACCMEKENTTQAARVSEAA